LKNWLFGVYYIHTQTVVTVGDGADVALCAVNQSVNQSIKQFV